MKLSNISKIFGVLAFVSFVLVIVALIEVLTMDGAGTSADVVSAVIYVGLTIIFLLAAILVTLKRVANDMEKK
jgi:hypothetical protein